MKSFHELDSFIENHTDGYYVAIQHELFGSHTPAGSINILRNVSAKLPHVVLKKTSF